MPARRTARSESTALRPLNEEEIVRAALQLAGKVGAENVSMRALATELGTSPMAIYYYVPNKAALLDLVVDAVLSQVPMPPPDPARWQAQLKACALATFHVLASYPDLSRVMLMRPNTKAGRAVVRYCISILLAGGFAEHEAALAIAAYNTYVYGVYALNAAPRPKAKSHAMARASTLQSVNAVVTELRTLRVEETIDFGIDAVLAGIAAVSRGKASTRIRS